MITDEEIGQLVTKNGGAYDPASCSYGFYDASELFAFASAIYQLGRQHQKEADAAIAQSYGESGNGYSIAFDIKNSTE